MKIALIGTGKMGKAIEEKALLAGHEIVLQINSGNPSDLTPENLKSADVAIEFTRPDSVISNLLVCLQAQIPVVCGTTGWHMEYESVRKQFLERNGSLLTATNFSIGVNLMFQLNIELSKWMNAHPSYFPQLTELHHIRKLDKPSGTAVTLAQDLIHHHPSITSWELQEGNESAAGSVLGIRSIREDEIIGTHQLTWTSPIDSISIRHEAFNRDGFAIGALLAAEWLAGKKGVFGMSDVLFSKENR